MCTGSQHLLILRLLEHSLDTVQVYVQHRPSLAKVHLTLHQTRQLLTGGLCYIYKQTHAYVENAIIS